MNSKTFRRAPRLAALAACAILVLVLLAACGGSNTKATATTGASSSTVAAVGAGSPTTAATTAAATAKTAPSGAATATTGTTSPATATTAGAPATAATEAETPTTASADVSPTDASADPLANVTQIDPNALPNFSLAFTLESMGMGPSADETTGTTSISMEIQQNAVDNYHLKITSDSQVIESWLVDGKQYSDLGTGEVTETPEGASGLFKPSSFLQQVPAIADIPGLQKKGEENVNGRKTTRYHLDGTNAAAFFAASGDDTMADITDGAGGLDVWIDNELKIQMKAQSDLTWKNADGTPGSMTYAFEIKEIGSTPKVAAPQ